MDNTTNNAQAWVRYFDYKDMMVQKIHQEQGREAGVELLEFHKRICDWAIRTYPKHSKLQVAYTADYATWGKFFDPRDNPVKEPYEYHPAAAAAEQTAGTYHITEPYASVEHQLAVAFTETLPGTHLLTFFDTLRGFERDFAPRSDLSAAERTWAAERSLWSYFWEARGQETEYPFPGVQPKVITNEMIRPTSQRSDNIRIKKGRDQDEREMLDRELEKDLATHNRQISMSHPPEDSVTAASERQDPFQSVRPHGTQHQSSQLPAREAELVAKYSTHTAGDLTRLKELMMAKFIKDNALRNKTIRELETMAEKRASRALKRNLRATVPKKIKRNRPDKRTRDGALE